jgi:predicted nucleic acid-binding protein
MGWYGRTEFLEQVMEQGYLFGCCAVNLREVYAGLRPEEEDRAATFLSSLEYLPITPEIAREAGVLRRAWMKKGQTLSYTDVTIAAGAFTKEVPLLADNRKHFPMPELRLFPLPERVG